jgi:hypothetical protein
MIIQEREEFVRSRSSKGFSSASESSGRKFQLGIDAIRQVAGRPDKKLHQIEKAPVLLI